MKKKGRHPHSRRRRSAFAILCIVAFLGLSVFAHPGRTDKNGGHWNRKTGEYHFHTGEYAGKSSSGGSTAQEYVPFTSSYDPPTTNPHKQSKNKTTRDIGFLDVVVMMFIGFYLFCIAWELALLFFYDFIYCKLIEKHLPRYKINIFDDKINQFYQCRSSLVGVCANISDLTLQLQIPDSYEVGKDNLPKDKDCVSDWGKTFTLYRTDSGLKLHAKYNCCSATKPIHIYYYCGRRNITDSFCNRCARSYAIPDMSWYEVYLELEQAQKIKQNTEHSAQQLRKEVDGWHKKCNSLKTKTVIMFSRRDKKALQKANEKYSDISDLRISDIIDAEEKRMRRRIELEKRRLYLLDKQTREALDLFEMWELSCSEDDVDPESNECIQKGVDLLC